MCSGTPKWVRYSLEKVSRSSGGDDAMVQAERDHILITSVSECHHYQAVSIFSHRKFAFSHNKISWSTNKDIFLLGITTRHNKNY
jgi:hypothetical protein